MSSSSSVTCQEITFECCDGIKIAGQKWENKISSPLSGGGGGGGGGYPTNNMMMMGGGYGSGGGYGTSNNTTTSTSTTATTKRIIRILCIHGLYDNCRSFYLVAPQLIDKLVKKYYNPYNTTEQVHIELIAIDLPGHGKSSTSHNDAPPTIYLECVFYIAETIKYLKWDKEKTILIGHSFGASVSLGYAATFPTYISKLILLDRGKFYLFIYYILYFIFYLIDFLIIYK